MVKGGLGELGVVVTDYIDFILLLISQSLFGLHVGRICR